MRIRAPFPISFWLLGLILLAPVAAFSQSTGTVNGHVVDAFSRAPVIGARAEAGGKAVVTDKSGHFTLQLPRGGVRLSIAADGYLNEQVDVTVGEAPLTVEVFLLNRAQFKEEVVVTAPAESAATKPPATIEVTPLEVRSVAGAAENVFRVLQTLPGVNATADFDSRIAVRGGGPDQNLTVMDGVEIHNPYRLFGLTSAFNPETVEDFQLTAGGFGPQFGDRLSSILQVENRAGTTKRAFAGSFAAALTDANAILEGRLPGEMKGSWLVSGRRTYYDLVASRFTDSKLPAFADVQSKVQWELRPGQRLSLFALRSRESTDAQFDRSSSNSTFGLTDTSRNDLVSLSFFSTIGTRVSSRTTASWYRYSDGLGAQADVRDESKRSNAPGDEAFGRAKLAFSRDIGVRDLSLRQQVAIRVSDRHALDVGGELHALRTSWGWVINGDRNESEANGSSTRGGTGLPSLLDSRQDSQRLGLWVSDKYDATSRLTLEPGLRLDWSSLAQETVIAPRLSAVLAVTPNLRLRAAGGLYTQSPGYEKLLQSDYFVDLSGTSRLKSERSTHALAAIERDWGPSVTARVEGYYKSFDRLVVGRLETPTETAARVGLYDYPGSLAWSVPSSPQITSLPVNGGAGRAYGFDLYVSRRASSASDRFTGWASYTWGKADRDAYGLRTPFEYDRRHAVSLVGTYRLSRSLEAAASARIASGFPYTPAVGLRVAAQSVPQPNGTVRYVPMRDANGLLMWTADLGGVANINSARLPLFARVDVRLTYRPTWNGDRWQFYAEVINVLNRKNAGALDSKLEYDPASDRPRLTYDRGAALPLLPSVGIRVRF